MGTAPLKQHLSRWQQEIAGALSLLGTPARLQSIRSELDLHDWLKQGITARRIESLLNNTGFSASEFADAVEIPRGRLHKLLSNPTRKRLSPYESLSVWQFALVFDRATAVMKSKVIAKSWLYSSPRGTGYRQPIEFIALAPGAESILRLLGQIAHGVFV